MVATQHCPRPSPSENSTTSDILEALAQQLAPAAMPEKWRWQSAGRDCLRGTEAPEAVLDRLLEDFDRAELLTSGLATEGDHGQLRIRDCLVGAGAVVILRDKRGRPFDVVTRAGCLSGLLPLFRIWQDGQFQSHRRQSPERLVLVTPRFEDFVVLRSLGVATAPATSLERLGTRSLRRLLRLVGSSLNLNQEPLCEMLLVAASVADLSREPPRELFPITRHLAGAERHLELLFSQLGVGWPTPEEMACLKFLRRIRSAASLRKKLRNPEKSYPIREFTDPTNLPAAPTAAEEFLRAHDSLLQCLRRRSPNVSEQRKAAKQYADTIKSRLFRPLIRDCLESSDEFHTNLQLQIANTFLAGHLAAPTLQALFEQRLAEPLDSPYWDAALEKALTQNAALTTMIEKLMRERARQRETARRRWPAGRKATKIFRPSSST